MGPCPGDLRLVAIYHLVAIVAIWILPAVLLEELQILANRTRRSRHRGEKMFSYFNCQYHSDVKVRN